ncbi:MAG: DUF3667 domain-containing protein [Planctomycetota bacterium]
MSNSEEGGVTREVETAVSASGHPERWSDRIGQHTSCVVCGAPRCSEYCGNCGQRHLKQRIDFRAWACDLGSSVLQFDRGVLFTFASLFYRPGHVAREYVRGNQKPFTKPLTCFFLAATAQIFSLWLAGDAVTESIGDQFRPSLNQALSEDSYAKLREQLGGDPPEELAKVYLLAIKQGYSYAALLFFAVPWAIVQCLGQRSAGVCFRLGETIVWAMYTVSAMLLVTAITTQLTLRVNASLQAPIALAVYCYFVWKSHQPFFPAGIRSRLVTWVAFGISLGSFFASILAIFATAVLVRLLSGNSG